MKINDIDFKLGEKFYYNEITEKHQILLCDTNCGRMNHIERWTKKSPIGYKKTTPFTVALDGTIYQHFDSDNWSKIFGVDDIDKGIIAISLENEGSLKFNAKKKVFINWSGDIYGRDKDDVYVEKWRGDMFWSPYTTDQLNSLVSLIVSLCEKHGIRKLVKETDVDDVFIENYHGIVIKNNYNELLKDINPSFNLIELKNKIEEYEETTN